MLNKLNLNSDQIKLPNYSRENFFDARLIKGLIKSFFDMNKIIH